MNRRGLAAMQPALGNPRRFAIAVVFAAAISAPISGCKGAPEETVAPEVSVQTAPVKRGPISLVVTSDAIITPLEQAAISPKITAPVKRFLVNRGAKVHKGQLLAVLENRDLQASAIDTQGQFAQAEATYQTTTAASVPEEMQKAQSDAETAKQALNAEQKLFESRQQLFEQGALPRKDLDQASVSLVQARSQYELAARHLDSLKRISQEQEIKSAGGQLKSAQGKYMGAEAQLSYSEIRSPIDGIVTERPLYAGEIAQTGVPLITVVNGSRIVARAHIPQSQAALLKTGNAATVTVPGLENPVPGIVTLVNAATDSNSTTIEVWVEAANPDLDIKPGFTGTISITAKTVKDALVVPVTALQPSEDGLILMVAGSDNHAHQRKVQVGIRNASDAQILDGTKEGEQVVTVGAYGLADGTAIKVEAPEQPEGGQDKDEQSKDEQSQGKDKDKSGKDIKDDGKPAAASGSTDKNP